MWIFSKCHTCICQTTSVKLSLDSHCIIWIFLGIVICITNCQAVILLRSSFMSYVNLILLFCFIRKTLWNQYKGEVRPDRLSSRFVSELLPLCASHQWWLQMWRMSTTTLQSVLSTDNSEVLQGIIPDIPSAEIKIQIQNWIEVCW